MWIVRSSVGAKHEARRSAANAAGAQASVIAATSGRVERARLAGAEPAARAGRVVARAQRPAHVVVAHEGGDAGRVGRDRLERRRAAATAGGARGVPRRAVLGQLAERGERERHRRARPARSGPRRRSTCGPARSTRRGDVERADGRARRRSAARASAAAGRWRPPRRAPRPRRGSRRSGRGRRTSARAPTRASAARRAGSSAVSASKSVRRCDASPAAPGGSGRRARTTRGPLVAPSAIAGRSSEAITLSSMPCAKNCQTSSGSAPDSRVTSRDDARRSPRARAPGSPGPSTPRSSASGTAARSRSREQLDVGVAHRPRAPRRAARPPPRARNVSRMRRVRDVVARRGTARAWS